MKAYPWRLFFRLWLTICLLTPLGIPYFMAMNADAVHPQDLPAGWMFLFPLMNAIMYLVSVGFGLLLYRRAGFRMPWLDAWNEGKQADLPLRSILGPALFWATLTALIAIAVDLFFYHVLGVLEPAPEIHARISIPAWTGIPISFAAGLGEELTYRLFLMSLFTWLAMLLLRSRPGDLRWPMAVIVGMVLSSLIFSWVHLGSIEMYSADPAGLAVLRTFLIIMGPGLAFGYLYWKRGLEAAILAHFLIDILVHVVRPLLKI